MANKRFKGKMGEKYGLIALAAPHYLNCERKLGEAVKQYFARKTGKKFSVLEIGCGSGITSEIVLRADKRIQLTAVDNEPEMIRQIKKRLAKYAKEKRVKIVKADALEYVKKIPSSSFEAFVSGLTIHNFKTAYRNKFMKNVYRLLKPEGLFANMDRYAHDNPKVFAEWTKWQIGMYKKVFSKLNQPDLIKRWIDHEKYDARSDVIMKLKPAIIEMKRIGFKDAKVVYRKKTYLVLTAIK